MRALLAEMGLSDFADKIIYEGYNSTRLISEMNESELACSAGKNRLPPAVPGALKARHPLLRRILDPARFG